LHAARDVAVMHVEARDHSLGQHINSFREFLILSRRHPLISGPIRQGRFSIARAARTN
jgi:hypothetical protein